MGQPTPRAVLKDPLRYDLQAKRTWAWQQTEKLARKARSEMVRLVALREFLERTDPKPKTDVSLTANGPLVIRWATEAEAPMFPSTALATSSASSTSDSNGNGHGGPSSSATDALASL